MSDLMLDVFFESLNDDSISYNEFCNLGDMLTEGVFTHDKSPLKNLMGRLQEIKDSKPKEYSGSEDVKKFVDKNYDTIMKVSDILEKEPSELKKNEYKLVVNSALVFLAGLITIPLFGIGFIVILAELVIVVVKYLMSYARQTDDDDAYTDLMMIRKSLKKASGKNLSPKIKEKLTDMIEKIDDMEEAYNNKAEKNMTHKSLYSVVSTSVPKK